VKVREKSSKTIPDNTQNRLEDIVQAIFSNDEFLLTSHSNPDGDSIGSVLALRSILTRLGKSAEICLHDTCPVRYLFLQDCDITYGCYGDLSYNAGIVLDTSDYSRLGCIASAVQRLPLVINIDHHRSNNYFGDINFVDTHASSMAETIVDLAELLSIPLTLKESEQLYAALISDSGSFRFPNTTARSLKTGMELVRNGVNPGQICSRIYFQHSLMNFSLLAEALKTLKIEKNGKIASCYIDEKVFDELHVNMEELENFANYPRSLKGISVGILFVQKGALVKVSFRSNGMVNVDQLAAHFGGGGHSTAAGCQIRGSLKDVMKEVLEVSTMGCRQADYVVGGTRM
jgi:phosphoesterase RecJ-like protein